MSIKLVVANRFAFTVKGHINGLDARPEPFTFTLTATRPPQDELRKLVEGNLDKPIAEVLVELVTDWSHVRDDHGNEVPFSHESFAQLLTIPGLSVTVWEAYISNVGARAKKLRRAVRALYLDARHRNDAQAAAQAVGSATHGQGAMAELLQDMAQAGYTPVVPDADALPAVVEWDRIAHDLDAPEHGSETPCETVYLWPDNEPLLAAWQLLQGQWRVGFSGPATFDAAGARAILQDIQPSRKRRAQWWPLLLSCADEMAVQRGIDAERAQAERELQQAMRHMCH